MVGSIAIALSSPHPMAKLQGWTTVEVKPKAVVESIPVDGVTYPAVRQASLVKEEQPAEIKPVEASKFEADSIDAVAEAKAYLARTAYPGGTITILGREKAIECFHPQFALNLAATIRDAREHGFPEAAVLSGCRPPRLGIGGFKDKKNSLHGVGLAADIHGIGAPCSAQAKQFHKIAASHGVFGAYGPCNRAEWNHVQGTEIKKTTPALRATFTPNGDISPNLRDMWAAASSVVLAVAKPIIALVQASDEHHFAKRTRQHHRGGKHHRIAQRRGHHRTAKRRGGRRFAQR